MYHLHSAETSVYRGKEKIGKRRLVSVYKKKTHYWFTNRNRKNGKVTSTSETYTRKANAINGMLSEITELTADLSIDASRWKATGYYDHTEGGKKPVFKYF